MKHTFHYCEHIASGLELERNEQLAKHTRYILLGKKVKGKVRWKKQRWKFMYRIHTLLKGVELRKTIIERHCRCYFFVLYLLHVHFSGMYYCFNITSGEPETSSLAVQFRPQVYYCFLCSEIKVCKWKWTQDTSHRLSWNRLVIYKRCMSE